MKSVSSAPQLEKHGSGQGGNQVWSEPCERIADSFASPSYGPQQAVRARTGVSQLLLLSFPFLGCGLVQGTRGVPLISGFLGLDWGV